MSQITKRKLSVIVVMATFYILLNFIPFHWWIPNQYYFFTFRLCTLLFFAALSIYLKHRNKIEIERPVRQISYYWLIPLIIPCFTNFIYVTIVGINPLDEIRADLLAMDIICDIFLSIFEDIVFVDMLNSFFLDLFECRTRKSKLYSMLCCATIFTLLHSYNFILNDPEIAVYELVFIFLITMECSYLAIYFGKEIIPIGFHILFNSIDFVAFGAIYDITMSWKYFGFSMILAFFTFFYILALAKISSLQKYRKLYYKE